MRWQQPEHIACRRRLIQPWTVTGRMVPVWNGFELDLDHHRLLRDGAAIAIERRPLELLLYLVRNPSRLIKKRELQDKVWQAEVLSDGVLASTVAKLRRALAQAADSGKPLETVRGAGYRWHAAPCLVTTLQRPASAPQLIARELPRSQLMAALDAAVAGRGQLLLIDGEAGIGKTALLRDLAHAAAQRGISTWWGAGYDGGSAPAFWPWVEVLRSAHDELSAPEWRRYLPERCAALVGLVPELCTGDAARRPEVTAAPQSALRFQLFDELTRFLKSASSAGPRLVMFDDLHWADAATLELLAYAARALEHAHVLLVAAAREVDVAWDEVKLRALGSLQRQSTKISLRGLSEREVALLAEAWGADDYKDPELTRVLAVRTHGNPLFVRHMLEWWKQRGGPSRTELADVALPPALSSVIEQRLSALPSAARNVLSAAAVAGVEFDAHVVAELCELELAEVLRALDLAQVQHIAAPIRGAASRQYAFTHSVVRDALYAALGSAASGALHAALVRALCARHAHGDAQQLALIAHHSLLSIPFDIAACVQHSLRAAAAARASTGFDAAAGILQRVLLKHNAESTDLVERCELALRLGADQKWSGQMRAAWNTLRHGAELALQLSAADSIASFAIALSSWLEYGGPDEDFVWRMLVHAHSGMGESSLATRVSLLTLRAQLDLERPLAEREAWLSEAEALSTTTAAHSAELARKIAYARASMRTLLRLSDSQRAIEQFRALDRQCKTDVMSDNDGSRIVETLSIERVAYQNALLACEVDKAAALFERCRELARVAHISGVDFVVELMHAGRTLASGELEQLLGSIQRLREAASGNGGGGFELAWLRYVGLLAYERGVLGQASEFAVPPAALAELPNHARLAGDMFQAWLCAVSARTEEARVFVAGLDAGAISRMPLCREDLGPLCMHAETRCLLGERAAAERLYAQLLPFAELNAVGPTHEYLGSVAHYLGLCAGLLGRRSEALMHFEYAETVNRQLHMPLQLARTRAQRARVASSS